MKKGKVQTNDQGINVLVEHEQCNGSHHSYLDITVVCEKMSDEEINKEFDKLVLTKADKISFLKKIEGFAVSNCCNTNMKEINPGDEINYGDLFRYQKVK